MLRERQASFLQCAFAASLLALPAVSGCGSEETQPNPDPTGGGQLEPPAPGKGVQFQMVTHLDAGLEAEHCQFVKAPAEGLYVNRDEVRYSEGSHHFLLYETSYNEIPTTKDDGTPVDTSGVFDCSDGATNGWSVTKLIGGSQNADGASMLSFPPDVAMHVRPGAVLLMNAHYVNSSGKALDPEVRINLHTIPEEQVKDEGDLLFLYNAFIHVPANGTSSARMRCPVHKDITIANVQSHMHARGVGYEAFVMGDSSPFYTNTRWEGVPVKDFGSGLTVKAGSILDYRCDYKNGGSGDVYQGPRSTDEMCMLIGSYYPADPATSHCSADVSKPLETGNIGAEWVGSGTATCAETFSCIQKGGAGLEQMTQCVMASNPSVSKEVSDAIRCLVLSFMTGKDPATSCTTEFQTCLAN